MIGLPEFGDKVKVWPYPGRKVQDGPRPLDKFGGGRALKVDGREVVWSPFLLEQLRAGDILLHEPPHEGESIAPAEKPLFDPAKATTKYIEDTAAPAEEKKSAKPAASSKDKG